MEVNPYSMLEVTLGEGSNNDQQYVEDPLAIPSTDNAVVPFQSSDSTYSVTTYTSQHFNRSVAEIDEGNYRATLYKNPATIIQQRIHCTICEAHVGFHPNIKEEEVTHPLLSVLTCSRCTLKYRYIDFPTSPCTEVRCRWCSSPASATCVLRYCLLCPFAFCESCIVKNSPLEANQSKFWECFCCNITKLWNSRALLWAVLTYVGKYKKENPKWMSDISLCCNPNKRRFVLPKNVLEWKGMEKNTVYNGGNTQLVYHQSEPSSSLANDNMMHMETAWLKQKLYSMSSLLNKMNEIVSSCTAELNHTNSIQFIQSKIENVTSVITQRSEEVKKTCNNLMSDFQQKVDSIKAIQNDKQSGKIRIVNLSELQQSKFIQPLTGSSKSKSLTPMPKLTQIPQRLIVPSISGQITAHIIRLPSEFVVSPSTIQHNGGNVQINHINNSEPIVITDDDSAPLSSNTNKNNENNKENNRIDNSNSKDDKNNSNAKTSNQNNRNAKTSNKNNSNAKTSIIINTSMPKIKFVNGLKKSNQQKPPPKRGRPWKKSPVKENKAVKQNTKSNGAISLEDITEFEGIPIKKCFVKLRRIEKV